MLFSSLIRRELKNLRRYQGGWTAFIYFIVTLALSIALAPKPPKPKPAALEDFDIPVAEEDRPIPVLFGTRRITGANVVWYGDLRTEKIKKSSLVGSSTTGYKYFLGMHLALGHGPFDAIVKLETGDKQAWTGNITANGFVLIDLPFLYGGKEREGGFVGRLTVLMGAPDQGVDSYLNSKQGSIFGLPVPAYRGVTSVTWTGLSGSNGGYIGNTPYVKAWAVTARRILKGWVGDAPWYPEKAAIGTGMNGAHIIYQCLTDTEWGQGSPAVTTIDDDSFRAAADQLFNEDFGLNLLWNQQTSIESFIQIVLDHIGGILAFDESTGKYLLRLVRGDYDPDALETFGPETISSVTQFERRSWGETVNELTLTHTDATTGKPTTIAVQDLGNIRSQQARVAQTLDFTGISDTDVMKVVAGRELAARSTPLTRMEFECNRRLWRYGPGDVFKAFWPAYDLPVTVFRVLEVGRGTLADGKMGVSVVEDIYALSGIEYVVTQPPPPVIDPPIDPEPQDGSPNVVSNSITVPPSSPADGDRYFVPNSPAPTGAWSGHGGELAEWNDVEGEWMFDPVPPGTILFDEDTQQHFMVDEYGEIQPPPWTPAIHPLAEIEDTYPDLRHLELVAWDASTGGSGYFKIGADRIAPPLTDEGDLLTHDGFGPVRMGIGPDAYVLTVDITAPNKLAWKASSGGGGGGGGAGAPLVHGYRAFGADAGNWPGFTLIMGFYGKRALTICNSWKCRFIVTVGGLIIDNMVVRRTLSASTTFIDSAPVTIGGVGAQTLGAGTFDTDTINIPVDTDHDYYVMIHFTTGTPNTAKTKTGSDSGATALAGDVLNDHTADATLPITPGTGAAYGAPEFIVVS